MNGRFLDIYGEGKTSEEAVERLNQIIKILRGENGCPWDREQTHESLRICLIEEAYETVEAIDKEDWDNLEEELGDVLLQVIFHGCLGEDNGNFDLKTIANRECDKMIRRHPHVFQENGGKSTFFSNNQVESVDKVLEKWENVKRQEKKGSFTDSMRAVPKILPALLRSRKIQKKAADAGFDWEETVGALGKVEEEIRELKEVYDKKDQQRLKEEIGDLLFSVVNVARFLDIDPEEALNFTSQKFIDRFAYIEAEAQRQGIEVQDMTLEEMDKLWEEAKGKEADCMTIGEVKE